MSLKKGFSDVDRMPDPAMLVAGMDATAQWPAVRTLRAWERERLAPSAGDAVLDVGCGPGDVIIEIGRAVAPGGRAVGVDFSEQMLAAASERAAAAGAQVSFTRGDAANLDAPDDTFDAVRSERTLQWVPSPADAVAEMLRVTKPGGRISIIDSDWRSFIVEPSGPEADRFLTALAAMRGDSIKVGGRLLNLLRDGGVQDLEVAAATHMWLSWDPDGQPTPMGFLPLRMVAGQMAGDGLLSADDAEAAVSALEDAARRDRFFMALTMFAVAGVVPQR